MRAAGDRLGGAGVHQGEMPDSIGDRPADVPRPIRGGTSRLTHTTLQGPAPAGPCGVLGYCGGKLGRACCGATDLAIVMSTTSDFEPADGPVRQARSTFVPP